MGLFGKKKDPTLLVQEGKKYADLILDWLKEPLGALRNASASDRVMTEHYMLVLCGYLAWEKISPDARKYFHNALAETSPYVRSYAKDKSKEINLLAVMLSALENAERDARKKRGNVMEALAAVLFKDFSTYHDSRLVKYVVYTTLNLFNQEIPTTQYANLRLPVPPAPGAAQSGYTAPAKPAAPAPAKPAPAPTVQREADYHIGDGFGNSVPFNGHGKKMIYQNRIYELVVRVGGDRGIKLLDLTDKNISVVRDQAITSALLEQFARENPELKYLVRWSKPRADLPDSFTFRSDATGKDENVGVLIWEEVNGFCFGFCPRNDESFVLVMRTSDGSYVNAGRNPMTEMVMKTIMTKYPAFFSGL